MKSFCFLLLSVLISTTSLAQEKSAASLYNEGLALLKEKNYEAGLPLLEEALIQAETEGNEEVIAVARKNGAKASYSLGSSTLDAGQMDEALAFHSRGIELNPDYSRNYVGLAMVHESKGDLPQAVTSYLVASQKYEDNEKMQKSAKMQKKASSIVGKLFTSKKYQNSIDAGIAYLKISDDAEVNYYLSRCYAELGQYDMGLKHAESAIKLSGDTVKDKYFMAKGNALENLSRTADAVEAYKLVSGEKYKKQAAYKVQTLESK